MKTIHQIYDDSDIAMTAVRRLEAAGVHEKEMRLVRWHGTNAAQRTGLAGSMLGIVAGAVAAFVIPAMSSLQPAAAALILLPLAGATLGLLSGALIGALGDEKRYLPRSHRYAATLRRGGALVIARVPDDKAQIARRLLQRGDLIETAPPLAAEPFEGKR